MKETRKLHVGTSIRQSTRESATIFPEAPPWLVALICVTVLTLPTAAGNLWWDTNGTNSGAGGLAPSGIWDGTATNWNTSSVGTATTVAWTDGETALFSAGSDATGSFTVTMSGAKSAAGVTFDEGTTLLTGDGLTLTGAGLVTVNASAKGTLALVISGSVGLDKAGAGELLLSGANNFTGTLLTRAGTLAFDNNTAAGAGTVVLATAGQGASGNVIYRTTTGATLANGFNLQLNGYLLDFAPGADKTLTLNGVLSGGHNWSMSGAGTLRLGGTSGNTCSGNIVVSQGTLIVLKDGALGPSGGNGTTVSPGATLAFDGGVYYFDNEPVSVSGTGVGGAGAIKNVSANNEFDGNITLTADANFGADAGYLALVGTLSGFYDITKVGAGGLDLYTANSYDETIVSQGTLGVWYPGTAGSGLATVAAGARLEGDGSVPGGVNLSGTVSPGASPAQLDSGSQTWNGGANYEWEVNDTTGSAGLAFDQLNITGGLTINATTSSKFTVKVISLEPTFNTPDDAVNFDNTQTNDWIIATTTTGVSGFDADKFILDDSGFSNDKGGGSFVLLVNGNNLVLRFDPAPVVTCPADITQGNDLGVCGGTVTFAATANEPGVTFLYETNGTAITSPHLFPKGITTVDVTATDSVGNTDTCSFNVRINDTELPNVVCQDISVQLDQNGLASIVPNDVYQAGSDNCGTLNLVSVSPSSFTYCNLGANSVTLTVNDGNGNVNTCTATVTITAPPAPSVVYVDDNYPATCAPVNFPSNGVAGPYFVGYNAFKTIQEGIDAVAAGGTVNVAAGTYPESIGIGTPGLRLLGPNTGIDPNTGARVSEAAINPVDWYGIFVQAESVTISGIELDGLGVCDYGIYAYTTAGEGSLSFSNNVVSDCTAYGFLGWVPSGPPSSGNLVAHNKFDGIAGRSVVALWNYYASVTDNVMTNTAVGIYTENANLPEANGVVRWSGNSISAERAGIWYNLAYGTATPLTITNNSILAEESNGLRFSGVWITSIGGSVNPVILGNEITIPAGGITPLAIGYDLWNDTTTTGLRIAGGSVVDADYGVWLNNYDSYPTSTGSNGGSTPVTLDGVTITGATLVGVYVKDNPLNSNSAIVSASLQNGCSISASAVGILADGPDTSVAPGNTAVSSISGNYITLANGAANGVSATAVSFDGNLGSAMTLPQLFATEDKIQHATDLVGLGLVRVKAANVYVTTASGSIQRGINAASAADTVNVNTGTYRERVNLNKSITVSGDPGSLSVAGPGANAPILDGDLDNNGSPDMGDGFTIPRNTNLSGITVQGFTIRNFGNGGGGNGVGVGVISWENTSSYVTIRDNTFTNLGYNGVYVGTDSDDMQSNWVVQRNIVCGAPYAGIELTDVSDCQVLDNVIYAPSTIFADPGDAGVGIEIAARARVGTVTTGPVLVQGNIISGTFASGSRAGINLLARSYGPGSTSATLSGVTVQGNEVTATGTRGIDVVAESRNGKPSRVENLSITQNTLTANATGIQVGDSFTAPKANGTYDVGTITIQQNNIEFGSAFGLNNLSAVTVNAPQNWWGNLSGPTSPTVNPYGTGVPVGGVVTVSPWLASGTDTSPAIGFQPAAGVNYIPTHLGFATQPGNAALGSPLSPQPVVEVRDVSENVTPWAQTNVTLTIGSNPGGGSLVGTNPKFSSLGVATFTDLAITVGGGSGYTLVASAPGLSSATSAGVDISNPAPSITSLNPAGAVTGSGGGSASVVITGANFVPTSVVRTNGVGAPTVFNSASQLTATLSTTTAGSCSVSVFNPAPPTGGSESGSLTFTVDGTPNVVYVDDNYGPGNSGSHAWGYDAFATIQGGVNAVASGGTVNVAAGAYNEAVNANKPVTLLGANAGNACGGTGQSVINGGLGTAVTISANNVTVDGFVINGATGISDTFFTGAVVRNNQVNAGAVGIQMTGIAGAITIQSNCVALATNQIVTPTTTNGTIAVLLGTLSGSGQVVQGNNVADAQYGYLLADVDAATPMAIVGGTATGVMQGVAVLNYDLLGNQKNSTFIVDGVSMSAFAGTSLDPNRNFHAGVYVFTGGANTSATVVGTVTNVTILGTGKPQQDSAGVAVADFSTGIGTRQTITVVNSVISTNANRGVQVRGANAVASVTGCSLIGNGFDPFGTGGNAGFAVLARDGAQLSVQECFIVNPSSVTGGYSVTAVAAHTGAQVTALGNSVDNNGCTTGLLAGHDGGSSLLNASGNWWGNNAEGTFASGIAALVDFTPYLDSGTDTDGAAGFQGDLRSLHVTAQGAQTGATGRVQEGVNVVSPAGTVRVEAGTYAGNVNVNKAVMLVGDPGDAQPGPGPSVAIIDGGSLPGSAFFIANGVANVAIKGFEMRNFTSDTTGVGNGVSAWETSTANISIEDNYFHNLGWNGVLVGNDSPFAGNHTGWTIKGNILETFEAYGFELTDTSSSIIEQNIIHSDLTSAPVTCIMIMAHRSESGITIRDNTIDGAMAAFPSAFGAVFVAAGDTGGGVASPCVLNGVTIENNLLSTTGGRAQVYLANYPGGSVTGVTLHQNSLASFRNSTTASVDATINWWGSTTGPAIASNAGGSGGTIAGGGASLVDYSPWLGDGTDAQPTVIGFQPNLTPIHYAPAGLVFSTQPVGNVGLGVSLSTQPLVTVTNEIGGTATQFTNAVALAITLPNPHGGVLAGTLSVNAVGGVATFTDLNMTVSGGAGYQLNASSLAPIVGVTSAAFDINNPAPVLTSISPTYATAGGATFTLTVNGSDFFDTSVVQWNGLPRATTYVSHNQSTAQITAADITTAGSASVTVFTPAPGGGTSTPITFWILPSGSPTDTFVDDDYTGLPTGTIVTWPNTGGTGTHYIGYDAFATIQGGVNAAASTYTVHAAAGTYNEDVNVAKTVSLLGAGAGGSVVVGPIGGGGSTFQLAANSILLDGFTVTRAGNNTNDWNNSGLNTAGVAIQGQSYTGITIRNCLITGMRTAIDINNSSGHTIRNNVITDNRTGLIMRNQTDNLTLVENKVTANWTVGVLFLDASAGSNNPLQQAANCTFSNNDISGNWYGQIVDRQTGGSLPAPGSNLKNFSGNWLGTTTPVISTANSTEPGYSALIPVAFGGTSVAPGGQPDICGAASANIDYTPWLNVGTDTDVAMGFQGDFSTLHVSAASAQVGSTGRIQEGVNLVSGSTVLVAAGSYSDNVVITNKITIDGAGSGTGAGDTIVTAANASLPVFVMNNTGGASDTDRLTIKDLRAQSGLHGLAVYADSGTRQLFRFENVAAVNNGDCGVCFLGTATIGDVQVADCALNDNAIAGLRVNDTLALFSDLEVSGGTVSNNGSVGIFVGGSDANASSPTDITIDGTTLASNGSPNIGGNGDIGLYKFNGNAILKNISIAADANCPMQITGKGAQGPAGSGTWAALGTVLIENVTVTGTGARPGLYLQQYTDVSGVSFDNFDLTGYTPPSFTPPAFNGYAVAMQVEHTGATPLNIAGVKLPSSIFVPPVFGALAVVHSGGATADCTTVIVGPTTSQQLEDSVYDQQDNPALGDVIFPSLTVTCPANITTANDAGQCGAVVSFTVSGSSACDASPVVTAIPASGSLFPVGTTTVTTWVADTRGISNSCSFTVTVNDTELPTVTCPADIVQANDAGMCGAVVNFVLPLGADNCDVQSVIASPASGTTFTVGTTPVTLTITDVNGNSANCSFNVTVNDAEVPTIICPANLVVNTDPGMNYASGVNLGTPTTGDNCAVAGVGNNAPLTFPLGTSTVTWTVTDTAGLTASCNQSVTVLDGEAPSITCPADVTLDKLADKDPYATGYATATDNSDPTPTITYTDSIRLTNCNATGYILRTWTATDDANNTATCVQVIQVSDSVAPVLAGCPADITVNNGLGLCGAVVSWTDPTAIDLVHFQGFEATGWFSGNAYPPFSASTDWGDYNSQATRVLSGTDGINSKSGAAHAVIDSRALPAAPNDFTGLFSRLGGYWTNFGSGFRASLDVYLDLSDPAVTADTYGWDLSCAANNQSGSHLRDYVFHTASDASGDILVAGSNNSNGTRRNDLASINHYTVTSSGWYTFEWVFRDNGGSLAVDLNLRDAGGTLLWTETRSNAADLIATIVGGNRYMWFAFLEVDKLAIDNTRLERNATVACSPLAGAFFSPGTNSVTCTATDGCGLTSTCSFNVIVNDTELPQITCPSDVAVSTDLNLCSAVVSGIGPVSQSDNCGIASVVYDLTGDTVASGVSDASGTAFNKGVTTVTYTITDTSSNQLSCSFTVTVTDTQFPRMTCPADIAVSNDPNQCSAVVTYTAPVGTDNCPGAATLQTAGLPSGSAFPVGTTINTFQVTDASANVTTCSFSVTVTDNQLPVVGVGTIDPCYTTQSAAEAAAIAATSATDNCGVASTNIWSTTGTCSATITVRVTDIHGNFADASYTTRIDNVAPTIMATTATQGAQNVANCATNAQVGLVILTVTASDNCGLSGPPSIQLTNGPATTNATLVSESPAGTYNYTWEITTNTANGTWGVTVTASDYCQTDAEQFSICVNKSQVSGLVQLEGFTGTAVGHSRLVTFVATSNSVVLRTWILTLTNTSGDTFSYQLTGVPENANGLSAKTAWNLREKLALTFDGNGQAAADFVSDGTAGWSDATDHYLRGADIVQAPAGPYGTFNLVNLDDYSLLGTYWSLANSAADMTGDGYVNVYDYSILAANFYDVGDDE